jgi:dTMP kinase
MRHVFLEPNLEMRPLTEALLVNASRAQLVADVIRPALAAGTIVLCDRYVHSTLAYQGYGRGLDLDLLQSLCSDATGDLMPDLTLLLDVSSATSRERLAARGEGHDRLERQPERFHRRVRDGFLALAAQDPRVKVIDGEREPDAVLVDAMNALHAFLP